MPCQKLFGRISTVVVSDHYGVVTHLTRHPMPIKALAMICGTHVILGNDVQPNKNRASGNTIAPIIIEGSLCSGIGWPCLRYAGLKCLAVEYHIRPVPTEYTLD